MTKQKKQLERQLYEQYANYLFAICYRYIENRENAEEVLNNGFLKAFRHYNRFCPQNDKSIMHWLKKIIVNECLMHLRKKNNLQVIHIEDVNENNLAYSSHYSSEDELIRIIQKLPVGYRTVFNLYAIDGYSHSEISNKLGIAESTSRSQLTMARKILKEHLLKIGYESA